MAAPTLTGGDGKNLSASAGPDSVGVGRLMFGMPWRACLMPASQAFEVWCAFGTFVAIALSNLKLSNNRASPYVASGEVG